MLDHGMHMGGISWLRGRYHVGRKDPDIHTLLFTLGGEGRLAVPGRSLDIIPGSVTLLPARQPFLFELGGADWRMAWLLLRDSQGWASLKRHKAEVFQHEQVWAISPLMDALYHQIRTPRRRRLVALLNELLVDVVPHLNRVCHTLYGQGPMTRLADLRLQRARVVDQQQLAGQPDRPAGGLC